MSPLGYLSLFSREAQAKPYDSKKSYWCPDGEGGFLESLLESNEGGKAVVLIGHEVKLNM